MAICSTPIPPDVLDAVLRDPDLRTYLADAFARLLDKHIAEQQAKAQAKTELSAHRMAAKSRHGCSNIHDGGR